MGSVFLFGAGASHGSGPCAPKPPPLGTKLFSALQATGGVASTVDADLAAAFARDFEVGMDRFWAEQNPKTTELLRDMARFFAPFRPLPGNYYLDLLRVLGRTRSTALMVTTNYDLLIEHAVVQSGLMVAYGALPVPERYISILKIHGSCNFLPNLQPRQISGISFDLSESSGSSIYEGEVRLAQSAKEIIEFCDQEDSIAPALAMYSPSKQVLFSKRFVQAQQDAWRASLPDSARIYVIGLRVHLVDEHIWGPLARTTAPIYYVGREPDEFMEWARTAARRSAYVLADSFEGAIPQIGIHHGYSSEGISQIRESPNMT